MGVLKAGSRSPAAIAVVLRDRGDASVDGQMVSVILTQMQRDGSVVQQEGGTWALNPSRRKA